MQGICKMYLHFIPINNHFKIRNNNVSHLSFDSPTSLNIFISFSLYLHSNFICEHKWYYIAIHKIQDLWGFSLFCWWLRYFAAAPSILAKGVDDACRQKRPKYLQNMVRVFMVSLVFKGMLLLNSTKFVVWTLNSQGRERKKSI